MSRRPTWWLVSAAVAAAVVVAAVLVMTRPATLPRDGSIADPATPDPVTDHLAIMVHAPGPAVSAADGASLVSMPWVYYRQLHGGRTIQIVAATGDDSCVKPAGYRVQETNSYVELWVYSTRAPAGTRCVELVTEWRTSIPLRRPFGGRTLLHPPTAPDWPASRVFDGYTWATP
ncbi:MAG TPA: hypothetical protein VGC45_14895 [Gryllotalpicola sp.]